MAGGSIGAETRTSAPGRRHDQLETFRQLGVLVCKFGLDRHHPAVAAAAAFLSNFQTEAGDYRGIYGHQYTPNYSAAITDSSSGPDSTTPRRSRTPCDGSCACARTMAAGRSRPNAGAVPEGHPHRPRDLRTRPQPPVVPPDHRDRGARIGRASPASRRSVDTRRAADRLKSRFLRRDVYPDRAAPSNWLVLSYPFWWTDLLSALDSLAQIGFRASDPDVAPAAWPGSSTTRSPTGSGIPGATGPRVLTAICGSGSPYAGCSTPSARDGPAMP